MTEPHLCPRCPGVGLFVGEARGLHPRACGACGGVWLPPDEAARILRPLFTLGGLPGRPSPLRCPDCASAMTEWTVGATDIALDSCAAHGTWFDRSEVEALAVAAARLRGHPEPDFSAVQARDLAPHLVAGAAAAIAAHAVSHADVLLAAQQLPPAPSRDGEIVAHAVLVGPDAAVAAVELTASAAEVVGSVALGTADVVGDVAITVASEGADVAGSLLEGLLEFLGGLFS